MRPGQGLSALVCAAAMIPGGCGSAASPTKGWSATLRVSQPSTNRQVLYDLRSDGRISYVAGRAVLRPDEDALAAPNWADRLGQEDLEPIVAWLETVGRPATTAPTASDPTFRLSANPPGSFGWRVESGPTPGLLDLLSLFESLRRSRRPGLESSFPDLTPK
ncbi:MAG: hypothetical protein JNM07_11860 [Phycisphaerae bacterium]|nr:hypothetical protein [Phycisphaerae bacterium]